MSVCGSCLYQNHRMKGATPTSRGVGLVGLLVLVGIVLPAQGARPVSYEEDSGSVTIGNGLVVLTLLKPEGQIASVQYYKTGRTNLLVVKDDATQRGTTSARGGVVGPPGGAPNDRGYYDAHWFTKAGEPGSYDRFNCTSFEVVEKTPNRVTVSFKRPWTVHNKATDLPVHVDVRYTVASGSSGFYSHTVLEHTPAMPAASIDEYRMVLKLRPNMFTSTAIANDRQRPMPEYSDRSDADSEQLDVPESRRLTNPKDKRFRFELEDKYHYIAENQFQLVYGWTSSGSKPVGIWSINPHKYEYAGGGPLKQDLTVQVGPYLHFMLHSTHLGTPPVSLKAGQAWKKTYGPFFVYVNQASYAGQNLWQDAQITAIKEYYKWPYSWAYRSNFDYLIGVQRGTIRGRLKVSDPYVDLSTVDLRQAWIGLADPGQRGSWATDVSSYQYWTRPRERIGYFEIPHVRPGTYNLFAFVPGVLGDFRYSLAVTVKAGDDINLHTVVYQVPRAGPTLWDIGVPDRSAGEFYIPDMNAKSRYPYRPSSGNTFRNYGSWLAFYKHYQARDPVYIVGHSRYSRDWFYVHTPKLDKSSNKLVPSTYTIEFVLQAVKPGGVYTLRIAIAGSSQAALQVRVNNGAMEPLLDTGTCNCATGVSDNGMARAVVAGSYDIFEVKIADTLLKKGYNLIYLTQRRTSSKFIYIMYDYIRLEGPR
eukprot:jgi/Mesen1/6920/ME000356S06115